MSKIEITSSNIDKFVKRFHKLSDAKESGKKLSESQELFAQALGCGNYNELKKILNTEKLTLKETTTEAVPENPITEGFEINGSENMSISEFIIKVREATKNSNLPPIEKFYKKLLTLINHPKSKISLCLFEKEEFTYNIEFTTCYGDKFSYIFGQKDSREFLTSQLRNIGFSELDVNLISTLLDDSSDSQINLEYRFEAIEFADNLFKYLRETRGKKRIFVVKFNKADNINNEYVYEHDLLYTKEKAFVPNTQFDKFMSLLIPHTDKEYLKVNDSVYLTNVRNDWHPENTRIEYLKSISNFDVILKKTQIK